MAAVCDILCEKPGDRVEFATSAIYENVQEVVEPEIPTMRQCNKTYRHPRHRWFYGADHVTCPGISVETHTHG